MADRPGITIGEPGQREVTYTGLGPSWRLVNRQAIGIGLFGDLIILCLMVMVGAPFLARLGVGDGWRATSRAFSHAGGWLGHNWWWLLALLLLPWMVAAGLASWRFAAEVSDPGYPSPRAATPPEIRSPGPRWPWTPDFETIIQEERATIARQMVPVTLDLDDGHGHHKMLDVDVTPFLQRFAAAVIRDRELFSERGAMAFPGNKAEHRREFKLLRDEMEARELIHWKNEDNHQSGYVWTAAAVRALEKLRDYPLPRGA